MSTSNDVLLYVLAHAFYMWWNNKILTLRNAEHWKLHPLWFFSIHFPSTPLGDLNRRIISYPFVHRDLHIHREVACLPIDHSTSQLQRWTSLVLVSPRRPQQELTEPLVINTQGLAERITVGCLSYPVLSCLFQTEILFAVIRILGQSCW